MIEKVLNTKNIKIIYNTNIVSYNIKDEKIVSVTLDNKKKVKTKGVFLAIGSTPNSELFDVKKENDYIITDNNCKTNLDFVYAVGDVIKKNVYQLTTASSEGSIAASDIIRNDK